MNTIYTKKYLNSYFTPILLPHIALRSFNLKQNAQLMNYLYHLKLYNKNILRKQDYFLADFNKKFYKSRQQKNNKQNLGKQQIKTDFQQELQKSIQAFRIYECRFKDLQALIIIAQKQRNNLHNITKTAQLCKELIKSLFQKLQALQLIICIKQQLYPQKRFIKQANEERSTFLKKQASKTLRQKWKDKLQSTQRTYIQKFISTQPVPKKEYYKLNEEKKQIGNKMSEIRKAYTQIARILAQISIRKKKSDKVKEQFSENQENESQNADDTNYQLSSLKYKKNNKLISKRTITSIGQSNNKQTYQALSLLSNNNISIKNHFIKQSSARKKRYRPSIDRSTLEFQSNSFKLDRKLQKTRRKQILKFAQSNNGINSKNKIISKSKQKNSYSRSYKKIKFLDNIIKSGKVFLESKSSVNLDRIQKNTRQFYLKSERRLNNISQTLQKQINEMRQNIRKRRNGFMGNFQMLEQITNRQKQYKKKQAQKYRVKNRKVNNLSKNKKKSDFKKQHKPVSLGKIKQQYQNSKKVKKSILGNSTNENKKQKNRQNRVNIYINKQLCIPKFKNQKQHSLSTIRSLRFAKTVQNLYDNQDTQNNNHKNSLTDNCYILCNNQPQKQIIKADMNDLINFKQKYVKIDENIIQMKQQILISRKNQPQDQNASLLQFAWGYYGNLGKYPLIRFQEIQCNSQEQMIKLNDQICANRKIFIQENKKIMMSKRVISASNALKQSSITQPRTINHLDIYKQPDLNIDDKII